MKILVKMFEFLIKYIPNEMISLNSFEYKKITFNKWNY